MTTAHCPKCQEPVTIPLHASPQARVQCPWCAEEYSLHEALRDLPPKLVVLFDPEESAKESLRPAAAPEFSGIEGVSGASSPPVEFDAFPDVAATPRPSLAAPLAAPLPPSVAAPAFQFEPGSAVERSTSSVTRPRPRKKQAGGLRFVVQTVGGGMLGLVIAQLILWWMPGNWGQGNRDPFGLASTVARFVPAIVPATLRGAAMAASSDRSAVDSEGDPTRPDTASAPFATPATGTSSTPDSTIPDFTFRPDAAKQPAKSASSANKRPVPKKTSLPEPDPLTVPDTDDTPQPTPLPTIEPVPPAAPAISLDPLAIAPQPASGKKGDPETAEPPTGKTEKEPDSTANVSPAKVAVTKDSAESPAPQKEAASKLHEELQTRLNSFAAADQAWNSAENPTNQQKVALITDLYERLLDLGAAIVSPTSPASETTNLEPVVATLGTLAAQPDKLTPLGRLAGLRLADVRDQGAIVVGVVLSHQARGGMHECQVRLLAKSDPVVTLVSPSDLAEQLPVNTQAIVLGRWITNPSDNLPGYLGDASFVLLHGAHARIPVPNPTNSP